MITITIEGHSATHVREEMARLLGSTALAPQAEDAEQPTEFGSMGGIDRESASFWKNKAEGSAPDTTETAPARERGKPAAGHGRRTKAEIAEDEAADKADAARAAAGAETGAEVADKHVDDEVAGISTGEERVDPDHPEDAVNAGQDAVDEAAETAAATKASGGKLTLDNVRTAFGGYVAKFGMPAAQEDGPRLISIVCGEGKVKLSDIPDDQAVLKMVIDGIDEMLTKNPYNREAVAA